MSTYQTHDPKARCTPTRSISLLRPAATVFRADPLPLPLLDDPAQPLLPFVSSAPSRDLYADRAVLLTMREQAEAALRLAQNAQISARRDYVKARASIGLANARGVPASKWNRASLFTAEQVRRRRSLAFRGFNRALAALRAADRAVATGIAELATLATA